MTEYQASFKSDAKSLTSVLDVLKLIIQTMEYVDRISEQRNMCITSSPEVVKLVDAVDSKSTVRDDVSVRVRPSGPEFQNPKLALKVWGFFICGKEKYATLRLFF